MRKLLSITLAFVLTLALVTPLKAANEFYALTESIRGATQQGPDWHYLVSRGGGEWQELNHTPDWGDNWQYSRNPMGDGIYHSMDFDGTIAYAWVGWSEGDRFDIAARFTVSEAGTYSIPSWRHLLVNHGDIHFDGNGWIVTNLGDGAADAVIRLNDEELYRGTSGWEIVSNAPLTIEANAGDTIWFIVEPHEDTNGPVFLNDVSVAPGDSPPPTLEMTLALPQDFGGNGVFSLRDAFIGATEHGPLWYYLSKTGDGDWEEMTFWDEWGGNNWQYTTNPHEYQIWFSMFDWNGVSAATGFDILDEVPVEMAAAFRAPQSGTLRIGPWRHVDYSNSGMDGTTIVLEPNDDSNPSAVEIRHNYATVYFQRLSGGLQESPEITLEVSEGDMIYFIVRPMELERFEAPETRVRMDDILLTFDSGVNFADNIARMPEIRTEDRPVPESLPSDPVAGEFQEAVTLPAEVESTTTTPEPETRPAPITPETTSSNDESSFPWVILIIVGVVVIGGIVVVLLTRKKK